MMGLEARSQKNLVKEGRTRGIGVTGQVPESCCVAHGGRLEASRARMTCVTLLRLVDVADNWGNP